MYASLWTENMLAFHKCIWFSQLHFSRCVSVLGRTLIGENQSTFSFLANGSELLWKSNKSCSPSPQHTHTQKITEAMIVGTNWPFSIFTIGQESGPRIIVGFFFLFLTMVAEFRKEKKGEQKKNPGHCFRKYWKQNGL